MPGKQGSGRADTGQSRTTGIRRIRPLDYQPPDTSGSRRLRTPGRGLVVLLAGGVAAGMVLWYVLTVRAVEVHIEPPPGRVDLSGLTIPIGGNWLARPGTYTLTATRKGYRDLEETLEVPASGPTRFEWTLEPLPGRVDILGTPEGATVLIDEQPRGTTPLESLPLDQGDYRLEIRADGFLPDTRELAVAGRGQAQTVDYALVPDHAEVLIRSTPPDAEIRIDGELVGRTPERVDVAAGTRSLQLSLPGFQAWSERIEVEGGVARTLEPIELKPAAARLRVRSEPEGALVRVDGRRQGRAPVDLDLEPDKPVRIELSLPGYQTLRREIELEAGVESSLRGRLEPVPAELRVSARPIGAELLIDGTPAGRIGENGLRLNLPARDHVLDVRAEGHEAQRRKVTLSADQPTEVAFELRTDLEARMASVQPLIRAADGQTLKLMRPGRFTMGSPRGEQGRRANELQRPVRLERLFYIGTHEVTNAQFRQFRASHSSGIVGDRTLDNDEQPVARVGFDDAAAFCNWLSERDGLEPAYRRVGGRWRLARPVGLGYRLPTEAEWAWAARFAADRSLKYPWGEGMPPPAGAGNFADRSAAGLVEHVLDEYDDGNPASALIGSFSANALGLYDLGGNVSEWTGNFDVVRFNVSPEVEVDPLGPEDGDARLVRGSSWRHAGVSELRLAWRASAREGRDDLGFRIVRYAE